MEKKRFLIAALVLLAVAAMPFFSPDKSALCPKSYAYVDDICCLDEDENGLCDKYQIISEEPEKKQPQLEVPAEMPFLYVSEKRTYKVIMRDIKFYPDELNITAGDTVEWVNEEDVLPHAIYEISQKFRSQRLSPGEKFSYTFNEAGEYWIYTMIYTKAMNSRIIVKERAIPSPTADLIKSIKEKPNLNGLVTALFILLVILVNFWILNENKKK